MPDQIESTLESIIGKPNDPYHSNTLLRAIVGFVLGDDARAAYQSTAQYNPDWREAHRVAEEWLTLRSKAPHGTEVLDRTMLSEMVERVHGWSLDALDGGGRSAPAPNARRVR